MAEELREPVGEEETHGRVDLVSVLYIFGGVPVIPLFMIVLFWLARSCNVSA